eukprot:5604875-Amphidinium_carterae.1
MAACCRASEGRATSNNDLTSCYPLQCQGDKIRRVIDGSALQTTYEACHTVPPGYLVGEVVEYDSPSTGWIPAK